MVGRLERWRIGIFEMMEPYSNISDANIGLK